MGVVAEGGCQTILARVGEGDYQRGFTMEGEGGGVMN